MSNLEWELTEAKRQYLEADGQYHECLIERDQLTQERDQLAQQWEEHRCEHSSTFRQLTARVKTLEDALTWYASPIDLRKFAICEYEDRSFISDMAHWGDRARRALAAKEPKA